MTAQRVVGVVGLFAWLASLVGIDGPTRAVPMLAFLLVGPGLAIVHRLGLHDQGLEVGTSIALSVALGTGISLLMVGTHWWHPAVATAVLILPSAVVLLLRSSRQEVASWDAS